MSFHRLLISAALAVGIASNAPLAAAREPVRAAVAVDSVDVEQVAAIGAGVPLIFTVFGTQGGRVVLRIDGARRTLELHEAQPGVYEGSYLIDGGDAIRPESRVTAILQKNGAVADAVLDEPLLLARGTVPWSIGAVPAVEPAPVAALAAEQSRLPSPSASLSPTPVPSPVPMAITGTPVPRSTSSTTVPAAATPARPVPPAAFATAPTRSEPATCNDCAVVESVRAVEAAPRSGVIGTIGGAIAGAILGKELGEAHQRRMLAVLGALGGALAGRQIERQATQSTHYEVDLRLNDGTLVKRRYEQAPPFAAGATIRLGRPMRGTPAPTL